MTSFKTVTPVIINDANLIEQPPIEDSAPPWVAGASYAEGAKVRHRHKLYQTSVGGVSNTEPPSDPIFWIDLKTPTNTWSLFEGRSSKTAKLGTYAKYRIRPGYTIDTIAILGYRNARTVKLTMVDPNNGDMVIWSKEGNIGKRPQSSNWYAFYLKKWVESGGIGLFEDLPAFPFGDVIIEFTGLQDMEVGNLILGSSKTWGIEQGVMLGATLGIQSFTEKSLNEYGDRALVPRGFIKTASYSIPVPRREISNLMNFIAEVQATPILYLASGDIAAINIYGIPEDQGMSIDYYTHGMFKFSVQEA